MAEHHNRAGITRLHTVDLLRSRRAHRTSVTVNDHQKEPAVTAARSTTRSSTSQTATTCRQNTRSLKGQKGFVVTGVHFPSITDKAEYIRLTFGSDTKVGFERIVSRSDAAQSKLKSVLSISLTSFDKSIRLLVFSSPVGFLTAQFDQYVTAWSTAG